MKLPTIDLTTLPDLVALVGTYGSRIKTPGHDDTIVVLATFLYESNGGNFI